MSFQRKLFPLIILVSIISSCSKPLPDNLNQLCSLAEACKVEAEQAKNNHNYKDAENAASKGEKILVKLKALVADNNKISDDDKNLINKAKYQVSRAKYYAELAKEEYDLNQLLTSIKAKTYRGLRILGYQGALKALELTADQMGKCQNNPDSAKQAKDLADLAISLAQMYKGNKYNNPDGAIDWKAISVDLKTLRENPPPEFIQFLSLAYLASGKTEMALYEIDILGENPYNDDDYDMFFHVQKAVILSRLNLKHLAVLEAEKLKLDAKGHASGEEKLAMIHFILGALYLSQKDYEAADKELVFIIKVCPNFPLTVLLTGEKQAANGDYIKAAETLEGIEKNIKDDWLVKKIRQRAKSLRDGKNEGECLFYDKIFLTQIVLKYLWEQAKDSETIYKIKGQLDAAQKYSKAFLLKITFQGKNENEVPELEPSQEKDKLRRLR